MQKSGEQIVAQLDLDYPTDHPVRAAVGAEDLQTARQHSGPQLATVLVEL